MKKYWLLCVLLVSITLFTACSSEKKPTGGNAGSEGAMASQEDRPADSEGTTVTGTGNEYFARVVCCYGETQMCVCSIAINDIRKVIFCFSCVTNLPVGNARETKYYFSNIIDCNTGSAVRGIRSNSAIWKYGWLPASL